MKKILISFSLGLLLSIIPITGFAITKSSTIVKKVAFGCCEKWLNLQDEQGRPVNCKLIAESPDDGSGVSVCAYDCNGQTPAPESTPQV